MPLSRRIQENHMEFEQNMARLLEIVTKLEQGDLTLEESVALYEEGIKLS